MEPRSDGHVWQDFDLVMRAHEHAALRHRDDLRKSTTIPYQSHLWSVAALALEHGADDRQVAAALLHDAVEDHGGAAELVLIGEEFGDEVATMVGHLSDSVVDHGAGEARPPWQMRKATYVAHLTELAERRDPAVLVAACDKLHNQRCILADYRQVGDDLWSRFSVSDPAAHLWYFASIRDAVADAVPATLADELGRTVDTLAALVAADHPDIATRVAAYAP